MEIRDAQLRAKTHFPGVDGVRAVAAGAIVVYHAWYLTWAASGYRLTVPGERLWQVLNLGVILFFAVSGFLLWRPFAAAILDGRSLPSASTYLRRRAFRILPGYWVILLIAALVLGTAMLPDAHAGTHPGRMTAPGQLALNFFLLQSYVPHLLLTGDSPSWTLVVEVAFYLLLPILALGATRLARGRTSQHRRRIAVIAPAVLVLCIGLCGRALAAWVVQAPASPALLPHSWHTVMVASFLGQGDLFAFGMLLAVLHSEVTAGRAGLPARWRSATWPIALAILVIVAATIGNQSMGYSPLNTAAAIGFTLLLALVVLPARTGKQNWMVRTLEWRPFVAVGLASYSVYLWHFPLMWFLLRHGIASSSGSASVLVNLLMLCLVTGVLSAVTYRFVELPAQIRGRRASSASVPALAEAAGSQLEGSPGPLAPNSLAALATASKEP